MKDILEILEDYISEENPRRWAKLASAIQYRRLVLALLKEILRELKRLKVTRPD
jgi:hypothetical protein